MARKTKKQALQAAQDPAAPYLFDENQMPMCHEVVESVRLERYKHTGDRLLDNDLKALRLVELLMNQWGVKRIAREMHISPHSVRAARDSLVAQGRMAPYKERVVKKFEAIVETGADRYLEALENGTVPAAQIPVGVGIFDDKRSKQLGEPTAITLVAAAQVDRQSLSVESINSWLETLPTDPASIAKPAIPAGNQASGPLLIPELIPPATVQVVDQVPAAAASDHPSTGPAGASSGPAAAAAGERPAGGGAGAAPPPAAMTTQTDSAS